MDSEFGSFSAAWTIAFSLAGLLFWGLLIGWLRGWNLRPGSYLFWFFPSLWFLAWLWRSLAGRKEEERSTEAPDAKEDERVPVFVSEEIRVAGLPWWWWGRLALGSWLASFVLSHLFLYWTWAASMHGFPLIFLVVFVLFLAGVHVVPVGVVLSRFDLQSWRRAFLETPEGAALSLFVLSAVLGLGVAAAGLALSGSSPLLAVAGLVIYLGVFSLSWGLAVPLGIPFLCSLFACFRVFRSGSLRPVTFVFLGMISTASWGLFTAVAGLFGQAG